MSIEKRQSVNSMGVERLSLIILKLKRALLSLWKAFFNA